MGIDEKEPRAGHASFRSMLAQARQTRETVKQQRVLETDSIRDHGQPYDVFNRDVGVYLASLEEFFPGVSKHVKDIIDKKHHRGQKVLVVDLAGAASASSLGADKTISATLQNNVQPVGAQTLLAVDILSNQGQQTLLRTIRGTGMQISFLFLRPVGPAASPNYAGNAYVDRKMARLLTEVYRLHAPGGEMYLDFNYVFRKLEIPHAFEGLQATIEDASKDGPLERNIFRITKPEVPEQPIEKLES